MKLDKKVADYIECYRNLRKYCHMVAPHICIGLENGQIKGEYNALELIANENPELLIYIRDSTSINCELHCLHYMHTQYVCYHIKTLLLLCFFFYIVIFKWLNTPGQMFC